MKDRSGKKQPAAGELSAFGALVDDYVSGTEGAALARSDVFIDDSSPGQRAEDVLGVIAAGVSAETGDEFFRSLVRYLAKTLEADYAFVGRVMMDNPEVVSTIAVCAHGAIAENFDYRLVGSACEDVLAKRLCSYPHGVQRRFPDDRLLAHLDVESCIGTALLDSAGLALGLMVVLDNRPLQNEGRMRSMLQIFAVRAAAELERMQSEEALHRYEHIVSASSDFMAFVDTQYRYQAINTAYLTAFGKTKEEIIGHRVEDLVGKELFDTRIKPHLDYCLTGKSNHYQLWMEFPGRGPRYLDVRFDPFHDAHGVVAGVAVNARDITEYKRAEEALRESEERFRNLIEGSIQGIVIDCDRKPVFVNQSFVNILGYDSSEEILAMQSLDPCVASYERARLKRYTEARLKGKNAPTQYEYDAVRKDGSIVSLQNVVRLIRWKGEPAIQSTVVDITERRCAEEAMQEHARQQATVAELGQWALIGTNLTTLMDMAVEVVAETLGVEYCKVLELLPDGNTLLLRSGVGWKDGVVGQATVSTGTESQAGYTLVSTAPVIVDDLRTETRFTGPQLLLDHGVVSGLSVIIHGHDRLFGVLGAHSTQRRSFAKNDIDFLQAVAHVLAEASERRRAEETLRAVIDAVPAIINAKDTESRYIFMNSYQAKLYGVTTKNAAGKTAAELLNAEYGTYTEKLDRQVISTGRAIPNFEEQYDDAQGVSHTFLTTKVPLHESTGQVKSVATISLDISDRKRAEEALRESEERFRAIVDNSPSAILLKGMGGRFLIANKQWHNWFNPEGKEIFGKTIYDFFPREHADEVTAMDRAVVDTGMPTVRELETPFRDGSVRTTILHKFPILGPDGRPIAIGGLNTDITDRKRAEEALRASEKRYRALYDDNPSMYFTVSADGTVLSVNPFGARQLGYTCEELTGNSFVELVHEDDRTTVEQLLLEAIAQPERLHRREVRKLCKSGTLLWARETARASEDADGQKVVLIVCEDSTDAHELSERLSYQASHDALTGLVNRREFEHRLMRVLQGAQGTENEHALCYLDLDQFKVINDICGHIAGDELLRQLSQVLEAKVRRRDTLARLGGDEFGLLMEHCSLRQAGRVAKTLQQTIQDFRFMWDERVFSIGASIGLVPIGASSESVTSVLSMADAACYAAKDAGRNRIHIYHEADTDFARRHGEMELVSQINSALEEDRFHLVSQPILPVDDSGPKRFHYELLLRMESEAGNIVSPDVFLPAAERYNISVKIDRWVISTAFAWLIGRAEHLEQLHLCSINLSGHSLGDKEFLQFIIRQFEETKLSEAKICFEITETAAIANLENATKFMKTLKERGCRFALDDFGSGLSSFAYLRNLPVDFLKIDGVFVKDIVDDPIALAMVKSINEIGQVMGKKTIAEFVENEPILEKLREIGVDYAQGYGVGRPQRIAAAR